MNSAKGLIYHDNNATTQVDLRVLDAMMPYFSDEYANANSTHKFGIAANEAVKKARHQVAGWIGAEQTYIVNQESASLIQQYFWSL